MPRPAVPAMGGGPAVAAVVFPSTTADRWFRLTLRAGDDEPRLASPAGLLRGRHTMTAAEARDHVEEARRHPWMSGEEAATASGRRGHAMRLAGDPPVERRTERRRLHGTTALAVLLPPQCADKPVADRADHCPHRGSGSAPCHGRRVPGLDWAWCTARAWNRARPAGRGAGRP
ncbi:hypothetical protein ACLGI4_11425 [Streptomyces sp. HMX112]|uniref:hypothetical protein n=1 Tax=Streptomyces sp. HMX112 TaxID=3390850 RepID=UPI003A800CD1